MYLLVCVCARLSKMMEQWHTKPICTEAAKNRPYVILSPNENEIILIASHKYLEVWIWPYHQCKTNFYSSALFLLLSKMAAMMMCRRVCFLGRALAQLLFVRSFQCLSLSCRIIICHSRESVLWMLNAFYI